MPSSFCQCLPFISLNIPYRLELNTAVISGLVLGLDTLQERACSSAGSSLWHLMNPWLIVWMQSAYMFSTGTTLDDPHLNLQNWFHFLILVGVPLFSNLTVTIPRCYKDVSVKKKPKLKIAAVERCSNKIVLSSVATIYSWLKAARNSHQGVYSSAKQHAKGLQFYQKLNCRKSTLRVISANIKQ